MEANQVTHWSQDGRECETTAEVGGYPYNCDAKDADPLAIILTCHTHLVWWRQENYGGFMLRMKRTNGSEWVFEAVDDSREDGEPTHVAYALDSTGVEK